MTKDKLEFLIKNSEDKTVTEWASYFSCNRDTIYARGKINNLVFKKPAPIVCSDEAKNKISEKRKAWLKNNPDRHPWKNKDKFKSVPAEKAKEFLRKLNVQFVEEYSPEIEGRFFSIDIALPDKMIALEINGNQHYNRDGTLKHYYQIRHDLLVTAGWNVLEIHYSLCFNFDKWKDFVKLLTDSEKINDFDYFNYVPKVLKKDIIKLPKIIKEKAEKTKKARAPRIKKKPYCDCGKEKTNKNCKLCISCYKEAKKSKVMPLKDDLLKLILTTPFWTISKIFGVSDTCVKKWAVKYGIEKESPFRKYKKTS